MEFKFMPRTQDDVVKIYNSLKEKAGGKPPLVRDFLKESGIPNRELARLFGASPYSKLQDLAGDSPNRLDCEATPLAKIMTDYGQLAQETLTVGGRNNLNMIAVLGRSRGT